MVYISLVVLSVETAELMSVMVLKFPNILYGVMWDIVVTLMFFVWVMMFMHSMMLTVVAIEVISMVIIVMLVKVLMMAIVVLLSSC